MFPDESAAEEWFVESRWPDEVLSPESRSVGSQECRARTPQPHRCRDRRNDLFVRMGTLVYGSSLSSPDMSIRDLPDADPA